MAAQNGIKSVRKHAQADKYFDRRKAKDGSPYFVLVAANKEIIGTSEMYASTTGRETGIASVKANAPTAVIHDNTTAEHTAGNLPATGDSAAGPALGGGAGPASGLGATDDRCGAALAARAPAAENRARPGNYCRRPACGWGRASIVALRGGGPDGAGCAATMPYVCILR